MKVNLKKGDVITLEISEHYSIFRFNGVSYKEDIYVMDVCTNHEDDDGEEIEMFPNSIIRHLYKICMRCNPYNDQEFKVYLDYSFDV